MSMFGFFKKKQPLGREELREEFERFTSTLRHADDVTQIAVGYSINMANSLFIKRFGSVDAFCQQSGSERVNYIKSLTTFEEKMSQQDPAVALGFGLFKMWIGVLSEQDQELMSQFSKDLGYFSCKGELPFS